jgi:hypothetical protein
MWGLVLLAGLISSCPGSAQERLTSVATNIHLGSAPVEVELLPEPAFASAIRANTNALIVLAVEGIEGATVQPIRINVFLGKPDANSRTPTADASFVGFIQLMPVRGEVRRIGHMFEMQHARGLDPNRPVQITLVPVVGLHDTPSSVSLRVESLYLAEEQA